MAREFIKNRIGNTSASGIRRVLSNDEAVWGQDMGSEEGQTLPGDQPLLEAACQMMGEYIIFNDPTLVGWNDVVQALENIGRRAAGIGMTARQQADMVEPLVRAILDRRNEADSTRRLAHPVRLEVAQTINDYFADRRVGKILRKRGLDIDLE